MRTHFFTRPFLCCERIGHLQIAKTGFKIKKDLDRLCGLSLSYGRDEISQNLCAGGYFAAD